MSHARGYSGRMPTVHFMGYIEPKNLHLVMEGLSSYLSEDLSTGARTKFTLAILDGTVSVECEVDSFSPDDVSHLANQAGDLARAAVDLLSFIHGWGLSVHLDTIIEPDDSEHTSMNKIEKFNGLCTAYSHEDIGDMYQMLFMEPAVARCLNDLIIAVSVPHAAPINCARVIDGIRELISPGKRKGPAGWLALQEALNCEEAYLQFISKTSTGPRHASPAWINSQTQEELIARSWTIMNRFLELKKRKLTKLPMSELALLQ